LFHNFTNIVTCINED